MTIIRLAVIHAGKRGRGKRGALEMREVLKMTTLKISGQTDFSKMAATISPIQTGFFFLDKIFLYISNVTMFSCVYGS